METSVDGAPDIENALKTDTQVEASASQDPWAMAQQAIVIGNDVLNAWLMSVVPVDLCNSAELRAQHARQGEAIQPEQLHAPFERALRAGRIVESTVNGLYHLIPRQFLWLAVTPDPQWKIARSGGTSPISAA